ncbi:MAG: hypothetical protein IPO90_11565 [Flavobacteriales bacterium]|nr:hypothetical protein [Flavobacteriales bacterium]
MALLFQRMGIKDLMGGAMTGALIGGLFFLSVRPRKPSTMGEELLRHHDGSAG